MTYYKVTFFDDSYMFQSPEGGDASSDQEARITSENFDSRFQSPEGGDASSDQKEISKMRMNMKVSIPRRGRRLK